MARKAETTRTAILDATQALILDRGFAATSIDELVGRANTTKGSFFYHFDSKAALAHALTEPFPGCLFASCIYEAQLFDDTVHRIIQETMRIWRSRLAAKIAEAVAAHPPRLPVEPDSLADMMTVVFEGAFIPSKTLTEPAVAAEQLEHYRNYLELLFAPAAA